MERPCRVRMLLFVAVFMVVQRQSWPATADVAAKSKYQIECTMCSACDNPCNQVPSPPPPNPSPPPPSPPPPSSSSNCPPPPSPPSNPTYYYSPPPPSQPTYVYSSPPPPNGYNGGGGGGGAFYPPPYQNYPAPPPPNPIVPYFPFWYHNPPPTSAANSVYFSDSTVYTIGRVPLFHSLSNMAAFYLYTFNLIPHSHSPSASSNPDSLSNLNSISAKIDKRRSSCRTSGFTVLSTHSNPRILKSNRRSRYGQVLSPYDTDDNAGDEDGDWFFDDEDSETEEFDADRKKFNSQKGNDTRQGSRRQLEEDQSIRSLKSEGSFNISKGELDVKNGKNTIGSSYHTFNKSEDYDSSEMHGIGKLKPRKSIENKYCRLSEEIDLDEKWFPLLDYLSTFELKESHFIQMYERHMPSLQINACSAQERLEYLSSVGVKHRDIKRIILRQPQILEYTVENNLKSHVAFLVGLGIPDSRIGHVIAAAPSLFSYSVENSLKPTVRYLIEEVGIKKNDLGKVVQLSPQILVQRIDNSWNTRYSFLSRELGAPRDSIVKMVTKHPQLLHYSIEDGFLPRINFLRSIGMRNSDILKVLTNLTQVLSLSLEDNLKPKYMYLVNELRNEVHSLTKYPMYLSLSLDQRIRPRHRFLVYLKKAPKGPFPLSSFVPTDECFCQQWAGTSLDSYLAFRQRLLLKDFAKKYEKRR